MQDLAQIENSIRFCNVCDYVLLQDLGKVKYIHGFDCSIIAAGGDCMHFEADKTYCECGE